MKYRIPFAALLVLFLTAMTFAEPQPDKVMKELNLTETQQSQFDKISFDTQKKQIELRAKLETAQLELHRLFDAETIDKSAIEKKMSEISTLQVSMRMNHVNSWSEKNKVLNADQQKIWKKMLLQHRTPFGPGIRGRMMRMHSFDNDMPDGPNDERRPRIERRIEKRIMPE